MIGKRPYFQWYLQKKFSSIGFLKGLFLSINFLEIFVFYQFFSRFLYFWRVFCAIIETNFFRVILSEPGRSMSHYSPSFEIVVTCLCLIRYCSHVFGLVNDEACCCDFSGFWWLINLMVQRQSNDLQPPWRWFLVNLGHLTIKLKWYIDTFTKLSDNFMSKFFNFVVQNKIFTK